jgi:hypothetical protein
VLLDEVGVDEDENELCVVELEVVLGAAVPFEPPVMANVGLVLPESPNTKQT